MRIPATIVKAVLNVKDGLAVNEIIEISQFLNTIRESEELEKIKEAYKRIKAGASLIQVFTAFIYNGPKLIKEINEGILELMKKDGFTHISQAIGADRK